MEGNALLDPVMRTLGAVWRALRLYPASSPMTAEATKRVCDAVDEYLQSESSLKLDVVRGGFILRGLDGVLTAPGIDSLADALGSHGVGELHFLEPPELEEMVALLSVIQLQPPEVNDHGGVQTMLTEANVHSIRVVAIVLAKIEAPPEIPEDEADKFLAELAGDPVRLAAWLRSLLAADDENLAEGILVLANAAEDVRVFGRTMAEAFRELDGDEKDRLLDSSIRLGDIKHVLVEMLANLSEVELTAALRGGCYGTNVMALSYALAELPVGDRVTLLLAETENALRSADATDAHIALLNRMVAVRHAAIPEPSLESSNPRYRTLLDATRLHEEQIECVRDEARGRAHIDAPAVATLLRLLDSADTLDAYTHVLNALARAVPHLFELGELELGLNVIEQIVERSASGQKSWMEVQSRFVAATTTACGIRTMAALVALPADDERARPLAERLVSLGGDAAAQGLAHAAVESEAEHSMLFAEEVLGRRLPELLAPQASTADAAHAAKLAELYARDGGQACMQALQELTGRPEEQVRARATRGILVGGGQAVGVFIPRLLRDPSHAVALVAVSALVASQQPDTAAILGRRLVELEAEKDLPLAREIINQLRKSPSPAADAALKETAAKSGFMRKSRHAEIRRLASEAVAARAKQAGS